MERINLDRSWRFFLGDLPPKCSTDGWGGAKVKAFNFGATAFDLNDSKWRNVDIPHDFVAEGDYTRKNNVGGDMQKIPEMESIDSRHFAGGSLEGGVAWYRKTFETPSDYEGKRVYICFDGVYRNCDVYLNEYFIGNHKCGYTSFYYDITDFINIGGENKLAVRVDSTGHEGWWYEGGGIYRHVWLEVKDRVHVEKWGTFISSRVDLDKQSAELTIKTEIANKYFEDKNVSVKSQITDKDGKTVAEIVDTIGIDAWENDILTQNVSFDNVDLWDLENTNMYNLHTVVSVDGSECDTYDTPFGIRDIRFDADTGFYLNGKYVRIQGLCCHHDHAGVGIATDESLWEYRIAQMKSMGTNGYRSAHHPPTAELLDICDRVGMLVFDETRKMSSNNEDIEALRMMVKRDRNHPCVFLWGIGNEEVFSQDKKETARTTQSMKMEVRKLDGTRPITSAVVCWNGVERFDNASGYVDVTKHLDVMGFNYCRSAWDDYHERMPNQPIIVTEAATRNGTRGCYSTDESKGWYYTFDKENGIKCKNSAKAVKDEEILEGEWSFFAERPYLSGIFLWTGMDYRGEPTPLTYPAVYSQFGIFDYCGFPKDNYYYYKSWWSNEKVLHAFPNVNFEKKEETTVYAYSNCEEVELFVNGKSYGKKAMPRNKYVSWENVKCEKGEMTVKGYDNNAETMSKTMTGAGAPSAIKLIPYKETVSVGDTAIINIAVTDKDGRAVPVADNELTFTVDGGTFLGTGNGNPGDHSSEKVNVRRAFNGLCQLLVKADTAGEIKVTVTSPMLDKAECSVKVE